MVGGMDGWISAALPTCARGMKYSLERQVRIAAGSLVFLGTLCGVVIHPAFLAVPLFVGGGLVFAGLTGFCGLGELLKKLLECQGYKKRAGFFPLFLCTRPESIFCSGKKIV